MAVHSHRCCWKTAGCGPQGGPNMIAWLINIGEGTNFGVRLLSRSTRTLKSRDEWTVRRCATALCLKSGSIMLHLAEKFGGISSPKTQPRTECMSWLFWQMGQCIPILGGGFGPLLRLCARSRFKYCSTLPRWKPSVQLDVLGSRHLADNE